MKKGKLAKNDERSDNYIHIFPALFRNENISNFNLMFVIQRELRPASDDAVVLDTVVLFYQDCILNRIRTRFLDPPSPRYGGHAFSPASLILRTHLFFVSCTMIATQSLFVKSIAELKPSFGGLAVYNARALIRVFPGDFDEESGSRLANQEQQTGLSDIGFVGKLYPNPNDGHFELDYSIGQADFGKINLFNITGIKVNEFIINPNLSHLLIDETHLSSGVYLYEVLINNKRIISDKIVIIK